MKLDSTHLHSPCIPVMPGKHLKKTIEEMWQTMTENNGMGLAANQVGLKSALFVAVTSIGQIEAANPIVSVMYESGVYGEEGCLSLPGKHFTVSRPGLVRLQAHDPITGKALDYNFSWPDTRVICHEFDHLCGVTIATSGNLKF